MLSRSSKTACPTAGMVVGNKIKKLEYNLLELRLSMTACMKSICPSAWLGAVEWVQGRMPRFGCGGGYGLEQQLSRR